MKGRFFLNDSGLSLNLVSDKILEDFLHFLLLNNQESIFNLGRGVGQKNLNIELFNNMTFPLPSIESQQKIVDELNGYQKIIDGCRQVVDNYKPSIDIDSSWEMVELGHICEIKSGGTPSKKVESYWLNGKVPWIGSGMCKDCRISDIATFITKEGYDNSSAKLFPKGTTLIALVGATIGKTAFTMVETSTNQNVAGLIPKDSKKLNNEYLFYISKTLYKDFLNLGDGSFRMANLGFIKNLRIPLPDISQQYDIVKKLMEIESVIESNIRLIEIYTQKIQDRISKVWGQSDS